MVNENATNTDKEFLEKMVQHYVNGDKDAAQEYLSQVLTAKANRLFNEAVNEEDTKKENEIEDKEAKKPEKSEKKTIKAGEKEGTTPEKILARLKKGHSASEDKEAFCKKVAKAAGMESCGSGDFAKAAKALHSNGKHGSFMKD